MKFFSKILGKKFSGGFVFLGLILTLHFNGCMDDGGTSTEAGNPSLTLQLNSPSGQSAFHGYIQFFATNSNPTFIASPPDNGYTTAELVPFDDKTSVMAITNGKTPQLHLDFISPFINDHAIQALFKRNATDHKNFIKPVAPLPDFNIVISGTGSDSTVGCVIGVGYDSATGSFRYANGTNITNAEIEMTFGKNYAGKLDTTGLTSPSLGLFVPGTPYYAAVQSDSFHFINIPHGKLPLRLVTKDGNIYAMKDSLGSTWNHSLKVGEKIAPVILPKPYPTLTPPLASPLGQYAFTDSVAIQLTGEKNANTYFTLDGSTPTPGSQLYVNPIILHASATLKAVAYLAGYHHSEIVVNNYTLVPGPPVALPTAQVFRDSVVVTLTSKQKSDSIFYTLNGNVPDKKSLKYTGPITLKATTSLRAVAYQMGLGFSQVTEEKYLSVTDTARTTNVTAP